MITKPMEKPAPAMEKKVPEPSGYPQHQCIQDELLAGWFGALGGWRLRMWAFVFGAMAVFAFQPLNLLFLLVPAFTAWVLMVATRQTPREAFMVSWWWGAGFFAAGLYWIAMALLVDAETFAWLIPFAIGGFAVGFGLFAAVAGLAMHYGKGSIIARVLILAGVWTVLEWVRSWAFTGFPWNLIATAWTLSDAAIQNAAFIGSYGLGALTVLAAAAPAAMAQNKRAFAGLVLIIPLGLLAVGEQRLSTASDEIVEGVRLRLVQPNIAQALKWKPELVQDHMMVQLDLGAAPPAVGEAPPTHVIWGETQAPFYVANHVGWLQTIGGSTPEGGLTILGAPRLVNPPDAGGTYQVANAMLAIDAAGTVQASYDKFHLVPFGEYVPLAKWLPLEKITHGSGSFLPGPGLQTLRLKGLPPVSPLICYEVIFPGAVVRKDDRPSWLLNLTNDAWYGKTPGPHQHFASARMRSVEEGLPMVRVANTGISGIIDGYGRVQGRLELSTAGALDGNLPKALTLPTWFSQTGNAPGLGLAVAFALMGMVMVRVGPARK